VGSLDAYYAASMDLIATQPVFDLYNRRWPILTWSFPHPPAKFVHDYDGRRGQAVDSLVAPGVIVSGATVRRSILSTLSRVNSMAEVSDSVLLDRVEVGRRAVVRRAILDKNVKVGEGARIGVDLERDRGRFTVSDGGIVAVAKDTVVTA
jgi:glucose-1-phosphate adenylyltransferase